MCFAPYGQPLASVQYQPSLQILQRRNDLLYVIHHSEHHDMILVSADILNQRLIPVNHFVIETVRRIVGNPYEM